MYTHGPSPGSVVEAMMRTLLMPRAARPASGATRRSLLVAGSLFCLPVPALAQSDGTAVDLHSHGGNIIRASYGREGLLDVAGPMKKGGVAAICLAIVADSPVISSSGGRIRPNRTPRPGELYDFSKTQFGKVHEVVRGQSMTIVKTATDLRAARGDRRSRSSRAAADAACRRRRRSAPACRDRLQAREIGRASCRERV